MPRRALTPGEISLARSLFADAIDYQAVRVYDRAYAFLNPIGDMSFRGNIYLPARHEADFAAAPVASQRLFIHEAVHVWQHQNNVLSLALAALREGVKHRGHYAQAYLFRLAPGRDLLEYGFEQQAAIIEEYFLRRHGAKPMGRCLNNEAETPALLQGVLRNFLDNPAYARRRRALQSERKVWAGWGGKNSRIQAAG